MALDAPLHHFDIFHLHSFFFFFSSSSLYFRVVVVVVDFFFFFLVASPQVNCVAENKLIISLEEDE